MKEEFITEFQLSMDLMNTNFFIYSFKIKNQENIFQEGYSLLKEIKHKEAIVFHQNLIASFSHIDTSKSNLIHNKKIDLDLNFELHKTLIEKLIKEKIIIANKKNYTNEGNALILKEKYQGKYKEDLDKYEISGHYTINFDINIYNNKAYIGFDSTYRFYSTRSLWDDISDSLDLKKYKYCDKFMLKSYSFNKITDFNITSFIPMLGRSIEDYYNEKFTNFPPYLTEAFKDKNTLVVEMYSNSQKKNCVFFNPKLLNRSISMNDEKNFFILKKISNTPISERMNRMFNSVYNILKYSHLSIEPKYTPLQLGYNLSFFDNPNYSFCDGYFDSDIRKGLSKFGFYKGDDLYINIIISSAVGYKLKDSSNCNKVLEFFKQSKNYKISTEFSSKKILDFTRLEDSVYINKELSNLSKSITVVIGTKEELKSNYSKIKSVLSSYDISTQLLSYENILKPNTPSFFNFFLGVTVKNGFIPYILHEKLKHDLYIGIDISHEYGCHTAAVVTVVTNRGELLNIKNSNSSIAGEKLSSREFGNLLSKVINFCKLENLPYSSIVIHRDGFANEELLVLEELEKKENITFNYISVKKNINRRLGIKFKNNCTNSYEYKTDQGQCIYRDNLAYLITTNPKESIGVAKPILIEKVYGREDILLIAREIHYLSFMNIGALNKSRLPVTTSYADKSSTFAGRGYNSDTWTLDFI